MNTRHQ